MLGRFGFLIGAHPPPFGPIALLCFSAAVVLLWRSQVGGLGADSPKPGASLEGEPRCPVRRLTRSCACGLAPVAVRGNE
jgi:hypothetical protein